ncbi:MAG: BREX-2 system adenine-specific DNA-methyltransferase PglX [Planctomycetes bacterium]|jgi:hypothetical protein|nr:BREX-2 system adenine-specific DNA-methyltransferase PglX [Planctomycetota bacterium]
MIDRQALLADLKPLVVKLTDDLRTRLQEHAPSKVLVDADHEAARKAGRTAQTLAAFTDDHLTQVAVAWVLASVFVRFVEDNGLCDEPWLSGPHRPQNRMSQARDRYTGWLRQHPHQSDRDYLLHVFTELGKLPGLQPLLGAGNTLVHRIGPTADGARLLREFWQQVEGKGDEAQLRHDFTDAAADTRFLGDLYQELSEAAQKKFALLQTPDFIEEFILDRTLEPALAEFGLSETRLIDPACGSGHFLLGAFGRLFARWTKQEPGTPVQQRAKKAMDAVAGVDLNPFAVAIARFRLLVAALKVCGVHRLAEAYDFRPQVANGDSLLHGNPDLGSAREGRLFAGDREPFDHFFGSEDKELLRSIFGRSYHAVVGNPPYIVARDKALNAIYRTRFPEVCHRKYSLGVPFTQLFFELARFETPSEKKAPGFVGMITANSFMKREFGSKLIEGYLNGRVELSYMLDLSGAYIPGHGTPTAILVGRTRSAQTQTIRAVLGIKGEPSTPDDPAKGLVWSAILDQVDRPGSESDFVSCSDVERERFAKHPWSIGGGGAAELKEQIEQACDKSLSDFVESIGFGAILGEDDIFGRPKGNVLLKRLPKELTRPLIEGDLVRDWAKCSRTEVLFPYDAEANLCSEREVQAWLWPWRKALQARLDFKKLTYAEVGRPYWEYHQIPAEKLRTPLSIAFAFVATHNHFVLDRGGKVFKQSAPIIKLPLSATEGDHLGLLGLLNSSVACFWLKQVMHSKGAGGGTRVEAGRAAMGDESWENHYEFSSTQLLHFPIPRHRCTERARRIDTAASSPPVAGSLSKGMIDNESCMRRMALASCVHEQEELDWECYHHFGLTKEQLTYAGDENPELLPGQRAFEIVLARKVAAAEVKTAWFTRHGTTPITEPPANWPIAYRDLVQRRIDCIEQNADIRLIEQPEYKRRWNVEPFGEQLQRAQRAWLLDRMEDKKLWPQPRLLSTARFAEQLRADADFVQVANLYRGRDDYDFDDLVRELVESEAVPYLPALRYKPSGLRKRADWEATWALQRREDAGEKVGPIPVPPKYTSADFLKSSYWSLRGKLDVPKERFVLYPFAERGDDTTPVFTWAGFDHAQQAESLAARYLERKEQDAATPDQLLPLLAGLRELLPWLLQWHNTPTADSPQGLGSAYHDFLTAELHALGKTDKDLVEWTPPAKTRGRTTRARATRQQGQDAEEP